MITNIYVPFDIFQELLAPHNENNLSLFFFRFPPPNTVTNSIQISKIFFLNMKGVVYFQSLNIFGVVCFLSLEFT